MTKEESSKFFDKYKNKTAEIHDWFEKQTPESIIDSPVGEPHTTPKFSFTSLGFTIVKNLQSFRS